MAITICSSTHIDESFVVLVGIVNVTTHNNDGSVIKFNYKKGT